MATTESFTKISVELETNDGYNKKSGIAIDTDLMLRVIYYMIGSLGIVGNVLVIVYLCKVRTLLRGTVKWLVIHQSVIDTTAALFLILTTAFQDTSRLLPGIAGEIQCKLWLTKLFLWSTLLSSTLNLCCITMERYMAVVRPLGHRLKAYKKVIFALTTLTVWVFPIVYNAFKITTTVVVNDKCLVYGAWPSGTARRTVGIVTLFVQFLIPLVFLSFCYSRMFLLLHKRSEMINPTGAAPRKSDERVKKNTIKTLALVSVMFFICWVWNQMYFFALNIGVKLNFANPFYHFTVVAVFSSCCVNPIIYLAKYKSHLKKRVAGETSTFTQGETRAFTVSSVYTSFQT